MKEKENNEVAIYEKILTDPDTLAEYTIEFFGKDGPYPVNTETKNKNGWKNDVVYKKRMKIYNSNSKFFNYSLSRIRLNYKNSISPFKWDFFFKTEKSFSRQRAVVFDSLVLGLVNYRYD